MAARMAACQKAIDLANPVDTCEGNIDRWWASDATMLTDDRRGPILWVTWTVGLRCDCDSAVFTDMPDYEPTLSVDY